MSDTDLGDLERQVAATLESHARDLAVVPRPFEPVRPLLDLGGGDPLDPPSSPSRHRVLRAVAAAVVLVIGSAAVLVARTADGGGDGQDLELGAMPDLPEDALVATWEGPDGWELATLDWTRSSGALPGTGAASHRVQLLGDPADTGTLERAVLVEVAFDVGIPGHYEPPEPVTVRGKPGRWGPDDRDPETTTLVWNEEVGVRVRATYRGLSTPDAVAVLDSLAVRPDGAQAGFDLPPGGSPGGLALLGEGHVPDPDQEPTETFASFGPLSPRPSKASVVTVSPVGRFTPEYLSAWFFAGRGDDDVARWWIPTQDYGDGTESEAILQTVAPDGWAVAVVIDDDAVAADGLGAPEEVARDITESVRPVTSDDLAELWEGLVAQWASRELVVSVPTAAGTVELRGTGWESVLCLRDGDAVSCGLAERPYANQPRDGGELDGEAMATLRTDEGDLTVAVSDRGPILMEVGAYDEDIEDIEDAYAYTYPPTEGGEAGGFWAAVLTTPVEDATGHALAITDVAGAADACLTMLGSARNPGGARPQDEQRIRDGGGGPEAMYRACRQLTDGNWYSDVGP